MRCQYLASYMIYGFARRIPSAARVAVADEQNIPHDKPCQPKHRGPTLGTALTEYLWWMRDWIYAG